MGTINYLIHHNKEELFCLGKGLSYADISEATPETLVDAIYHEFQEGFYGGTDEEKRAWAKRVGAAILNTIGLIGIEHISDSYDTLSDEYCHYTVVGSAYSADDSVGKPYKTW